MWSQNNVKQDEPKRDGEINTQNNHTENLMLLQLQESTEVDLIFAYLGT